MTEAYVSQALDLYTLVYSFIIKKVPTPFVWIPEDVKFERRDIFDRQYWLFYVNVYIIGGIIGFGSLVDVVVHYSDPKVNMYLLLFAVTFGAFSIIFWGFVTLFLANFKTFVLGVNSMRDLMKSLGTHVKSFSKFSLEYIF